MAGKLEITWKKSTIGSPKKVRDTIRGLGLKRLNQTVVRSDLPEIRGMVKKVIHLLDIKEI